MTNCQPLRTIFLMVRSFFYRTSVLAYPLIIANLLPWITSSIISNLSDAYSKLTSINSTFGEITKATPAFLLDGNPEWINLCLPYSVIPYPVILDSICKEINQMKSSQKIKLEWSISFCSKRGLYIKIIQTWIWLGECRFDVSDLSSVYCKFEFKNLKNYY